jgi:hypothetical protein
VDTLRSPPEDTTSTTGVLWRQNGEGRFLVVDSEVTLQPQRQFAHRRVAVQFHVVDVELMAFDQDFVQRLVPLSMLVESLRFAVTMRDEPGP